MTDQPARYRDRTAEIEAVQWTGRNAEQLHAFAPDRFATATLGDLTDPEDDALVLIEESHWVAIRPGCWVLRYPNHFGIESDEAFRAGWEPATVPPSADRAALRQRVAETIHRDLTTHRGRRDQGLLGIVPRLTDAVLAVLPADTDRAAVLREAVAALDAHLESFFREWPEERQNSSWANGWKDATAELRRMADETPAATTVDLPTLAAALDGIHDLIATSSRDWQTYRVDAWLWAVLCGWDCEQAEHTDTCTHGALEETAAMHGWDADTVAKARRYRAAVRVLTDTAAGARQDGARP